MSTVNRFTNIEPAKYNPRSLQELMMVPAYKRQQHTATEEQLAAAETALAQVDPLAVHSDLAKMEQQKLYDQITAQSEQLANKGFTSTSKSDVIRLNKDYQQAISPTGKLGQINAAKKAYAKNLEQFMKDADPKWSNTDLIRNWNKFEKAYTGFNKQGNITNIGQFGAPEKIELDEKMKTAKALLGDQVVNEIAAGNYSITPNEDDGSLQIINKSGRRIETSNAKNIQAALRGINSELSDPNSAWRKSIEFEGLDTGLLSDQINEKFRSMLSTKVSDTRRESIAITGYKNALDRAYENKEIDFEKWTGQNVNLFHKDEINKLKGVIAGDISVVGEEYMRRGEPSLLAAIADVMTGKAPLTDAKFETLNDPLKRRVETVFEGLKRRGDIPEDAKIGDKATLQQVVNYMELFTDETIQPKIIKEKDIKSATEKGNMIVAQARSREFYDMKSGKTYSYDDMVDATLFTGDTKEDQSSTTYRGQLTSDNRVSTTLPVDQANSYAMPHVVSIKGREFLVPGSESERNSPWYKKELEFHNEYNQLLPGLPKPYVWAYQDEEGKYINRDVTITSQDNNTYIMEGRNLKDSSKIEKTILTEAELKEIITDLINK